MSLAVLRERAGGGWEAAQQSKPERAVNGERKIRYWLGQPIDVLVTGRPALAVALRESSARGAAHRACGVSLAGSR